MINVDLMIFDLDGTLVDSRKDIVKAVNYVLGKLGIKAKPFDEIVSYVGTGVEDLLAKSTTLTDAETLKRALSIFEEYFSEHSSDESVLYPHVRETLEFFRDKTKVVVTNRMTKFSELTLKILGVYGYFEEIVGGDDKNCRKPSGCQIESFFERFERPIARDRVIMIGDMAIDVLSGKAVGIITCAVTYGLVREDEIRKVAPDYIIDDIIELRDIIT